MALTVQVEKRLGNFSLRADFSAGGGEPLALLGASGSGKSVTLKCIAGLCRPDRGRIVLNGRVLFDSEAGIDLPPQERRTGFLFQHYALFPNMTVEKNIAACLSRLEKSRRARRTAELLALLHLEHAGRLYPRQLSGGEQQRAALARILAAEPEAILLDEPFSALDSFLKWQVERELREVLDRFPGPVLWVSHDRGEVCRNCRRLCVLTEGVSSAVAGVAEWMTNPVTVSAARLAGCRNFLPVRPGPGPGLLEVPDWGLTFRSAVPWREGVTALGIRGSCLHPAGPGEENVFSCRLLRVIEDAFSVELTLCPLEREGPPLLAELSKEVWSQLSGRERLSLAVSPEDLMLLE